MQTYKIVYTCQSSLNQIPNSQTIFGAICNIIKHTKGESALYDYVDSLKGDNPDFIHSSMFIDGFLPMVKKNIISIDVVNKAANETSKENILSILEEFKKFKKISLISMNVYKEYILNFNLDKLTLDIMNNKGDLRLENQTLLMRTDECPNESKSVLLTRNGYPEEDSLDKSLFYSTNIYYPKGTKFCIYVKTNKSKEELKNIFKYLEYFGIGSRRTVGSNVFHLEKIEKIDLKSASNHKLILSRYIPNEEVDYKNSYYQLNTQIYRSSKDFEDSKLLGKFTHIVEGSYMAMKEDKEYYGKIVDLEVNGRNLYHYAIGFVL